MSLRLFVSYLRTDIVLHDLDLFGKILFTQEVTDKVLGSCPTLITGDRGLGNTNSNKQDQEKLHSGGQ